MSDLPFGFDKPKDSPGFLLWQTTVTWQRVIKKSLEPYNISHSQFVIMALLLWLKEHKYETTQTLIANWSKLDKMTVSKSLKKLIDQDLICRVEHKTDTRAKSISLTSKGNKLIHRLVPIVEKNDSEFFSKVSKRDEKLLIQIFNKLTADNND
jgi:DNA-binding MarR family transcriptional regulator